MRLNAVNLLSNAGIASSLLFIPLMAQDFGASRTMIGFIVAVYGLTSFLSYYFFGRLSDHYGRVRVMQAGLASCVLGFALQVLARDPVTLLLARGLAGLTTGTFFSSLVAYAHETKHELGVFSSYGSLGWAGGVLAAGVIGGFKAVFIASSVYFLAAFLLSLKVPEHGFRHVRVPLIPVKLVRENARVYASYLLRHTGANMVWTIYPIYMMGLGASLFWIGASHTANTFTQFLVMRKIDHVSNLKLIQAGLVGSTLVFIAFTQATHYMHAVAVNFVLGASWAMLYVGSVKNLAEKNVERASSVGLLNSTISLASIIGPVLSGVLTQVYGLKAAFMGAVALCLAALAAFKFFRD